MFCPSLLQADRVRQYISVYVPRHIALTSNTISETSTLISARNVVRIDREYY